jgi:hypothetical protein
MEESSGQMSGCDEDVNSESDSDADVESHTSGRSSSDAEPTAGKIKVSTVDVLSRFASPIMKCDSYFAVGSVSHLSGASTKLFDAMVRGSLSTFARRLRRVISQTMPQHFFGSKEVVYQAYMCAFITAAAHNHSDNPKWDIDVGRYGGVRVVRPHRAAGSRLPYRRSRVQQTRNEGARQSAGVWGVQRRRLTKMADKALKQIETNLDRDAIRADVTELHEYGIAILGAYCAVVGRSLSRKKGGRKWKVTKTYLSDEDEIHRAKRYAPVS